MNKFTKQEIVRAHGKLTEVSQEVSALLEEVNENIRLILNRNHGASIFIDDKCFILDESESIVSTFGNFIDLYFMLQKKQLSSWRPDADLSMEEKAEDMELIRGYKHGDIKASMIHSSLNSMENSPIVRVRLEPAIEEVAEIYDSRRFVISDDKDFINISYGNDHCFKLPKSEKL